MKKNIWRASRYVIDGKLIDFGKENEVNTLILIHELLDIVDELGSRSEIERTYQMLENGSGAGRQTQSL